MNVVHYYTDGLNGAIGVVAKFKNHGAVTPLAHTSSWRGS
jgi:hypothetical protein